MEEKTVFPTLVAVSEVEQNIFCELNHPIGKTRSIQRRSTEYEGLGVLHIRISPYPPDLGGSSGRRQIYPTY